MREREEEKWRREEEKDYGDEWRWGEGEQRRK